MTPNPIHRIDPEAAPEASKFLLDTALAIFSQRTLSDDERDAVVTFFEIWRIGQFLTVEHAQVLLAAFEAAEEYAGWQKELAASVKAGLKGRIN